jgi:uncharacterized cupin superfamily protein
MSPLDVAALIPFGRALGDPLVWTPAEVLSGGASQRAWVLYEDPTRQFAAGLWECDEGLWTVRYTECEFVQMLAGRIRIVDAAQNVREVVAGESFVIPVGFRGTWEVLEPARKYFVTFEARGNARES